MAQRPAIHFADIFAPRGLALAERRLAYLAELYDSGRWRRFYHDTDFLEVVREARTAVEAWRRLMPGGSDDVWQDALEAVAEAVLAPVDSPPVPVIEDNPIVDDEEAIAWDDDLFVPEHFVPEHSTRLPPLAFSADAVEAERDLRRA